MVRPRSLPAEPIPSLFMLPLPLPFPEIVMSEDQAWAVLALRAGHAIRYVPEAPLYHGHRYSLRQALRRNFDSGSSLAALGLAGGMWRAALPHLARAISWIASRHGVAAHGPLVAARAILYECTQMAGFQLGRWERLLPRGVAHRLGEARRR